MLSSMFRATMFNVVAYHWDDWNASSGWYHEILCYHFKVLNQSPCFPASIDDRDLLHRGYDIWLTGFPSKIHPRRVSNQFASTLYPKSFWARVQQQLSSPYLVDLRNFMLGGTPHYHHGSKSFWWWSSSDCPFSLSPYPVNFRYVWSISDAVGLQD